MKKHNIILGLVLSITVTILVVIQRLNYPGFGDYIGIIVIKNFARLMLIWFGHLYLMTSDIYNKLLPKAWIRNVVSIILVTFLVHYILDLFTPLQMYDDRFQRWNFVRVLIWSIMYFGILFSQKIITDRKNAELETSELKKLALEAKLSSFQEQLSPHFMFNSLNTLSSMTEEVAVQNFVEKLAAIYRYILTSKKQNTLLLKEELEFTQNYWYILKERFGDAIELEVDIESDTTQILIPPMAIQTLVENSIKHNKATNREPLKVCIKEINGFIVVANPIQKKRVMMETTGIGLKNLVERYKLLFDKEVKISSNEQFIVELPIVRL